MLFALLAYHVEEMIQALTPQEDDALMSDLHKVHDRLVDAGHMGPAARLGPTASASTVRRGARLALMDGPFAETKEQLLGFYVLDVPSFADAVQAAADLGAVNPTAVYEIRPIITYLPGAPITAP
jgi:hypothetical protein